MNKADLKLALKVLAAEYREMKGWAKYLHNENRELKKKVSELREMLAVSMAENAQPVLDDENRDWDINR